MKARKKPVEVEFWRFNRVLWEQDASVYPMVSVNSPISSPMFRGHPVIVTLEGNMIVSDGDYIIKGVNGEFYPCKPDIFEKTYDIIN